MDIDPIPLDKEITQLVLAHGINQVHKCIEDVRKQAESNFQYIRYDINELKQKVHLMEEELSGHIEVDGVRTKVKNLWSMLSTGQVFWRTVLSTGSGVAGCFILYRISVTIWPSLWELLKALNRLALK